MGLYSNIIFPMFFDFVMEKPFKAAYRRKILSKVTGNILEIGFGTGLNLPHYPDHVRKIVTVDPNPGMNKKAQKRIAKSNIEVETHILGSEHLPFEDGVFDCVVSTWTLCSIPEISQAISEIKRVLKVNGQFMFLEHGLSSDSNVQKWQHRLNPLQKCFADGCHINRNMKALLEAANFSSLDIKEFYLEQTPMVMGYMYQGIAIK